MLYSWLFSSSVSSSSFSSCGFISISLNCVSDLMSIFQFVSLAANLAFCPDFPIANDNWSSGTITWANFSSSLMSTANICAGSKLDAM